MEYEKTLVLSIMTIFKNLEIDEDFFKIKNSDSEWEILALYKKFSVNFIIIFIILKKE